MCLSLITHGVNFRKAIGGGLRLRFKLIPLLKIRNQTTHVQGFGASVQSFAYFSFEARDREPIFANKSIQINHLRDNKRLPRIDVYGDGRAGNYCRRLSFFVLAGLVQKESASTIRFVVMDAHGKGNQRGCNGGGITLAPDGVLLFERPGPDDR